MTKHWSLEIKESRLRAWCAKEIELLLEDQTKTSAKEFIWKKRQARDFKRNDGMTWENWEHDVALVENILLYFVIGITLVSLAIVFACTCYKFLGYVSSSSVSLLLNCIHSISSCHFNQFQHFIFRLWISRNFFVAKILKYTSTAILLAFSWSEGLGHFIAARL